MLIFIKKHILKQVLIKIMLLYEDNFGTTLLRHRIILVKNKEVIKIHKFGCTISNLNYCCIAGTYV